MYTAEELNGTEFLLRLCREAEGRYAFKAENKKDLELWQEAARQALIDTLGIDKLEALKTEYTCDFVGSMELEGYRRDKYIFSAFEGLKMPVYVLVPQSCNGKGVLAIHGHGSYGKAGVCGIIPDEVGDNTKHFYAFGVDLAREGYIAVCPDIIGSGERTEGICKDKLSSCCDKLANTLNALGLSFQGLAVAELTALVDFSLGLSENKYDKMACVGFSGGGILSLLMGALCDKIDMAVVSGYFHSQKDTCLQSNHCGCNFVPYMWKTMDCGELAALACPKPLYIELGKEDKLHGRSGLDSVYSQYETAKKAYSLANSGDNLQLTLCEGGHSWYGTCYSFLNNALGQINKK